MAALESGQLTPDQILYDNGSLKVGGQEFKNAGDAVHGAIALRQALTVSSDVFFYQLGQSMNNDGDGLDLQRWARRLGSAARPGIDLPAESPGVLPTPKWRNAGNREFNRCKQRKQPTQAQIYEGICGFFDRPWSVGDNINLSVGQGDLAADPLQMAVAYAAVANGGRVLKPRLGMRIEDASGRALQQLEAPTARKLEIAPEYRQAILDGLRGGGERPGRHLDAGLRGLPDPDRRQDRHRGEGRRARRPVLVRGAGAVPEPEVRRGRDRRGRRLRRRYCRPDGA